MAVRIGHASIDERGKAIGGSAGDQTGKEVKVSNWYNGGWQFVARAKSEAVAEKMAAACEHGCGNPHIGYDRGGRNTLRAEAKKVGYSLDLIKTPCETDCSAFMGVCVEAAGIELPEGNGPTTRNLRKILEDTAEFEILTDSKYLTSDKHLLRGDILCKESSHTVMALSDGAAAQRVTSAPEKEASVTYSVTLPLLKKGSTGDCVKALQILLIGMDYGCGKWGADGDFGEATEDAVKKFQKDMGLEVDGKVGGQTWAALLGDGR